MIKVKDFLKLDNSGLMFSVIDASQPGCKSLNPKVMMEADKNVINWNYGEWTVDSFEPKTKRNIYLWIKK